jgi:hypothetical protein
VRNQYYREKKSYLQRLPLCKIGVFQFQIASYYDKVVFSTTSEQSRSESKELADLTNDTNQKAILTKKLLAALMRDVNDAKDCLVSNRSELKIKENFVDTFTR